MSLSQFELLEFIPFGVESAVSVRELSLVCGLSLKVTHRKVVKLAKYGLCCVEERPFVGEERFCCFYWRENESR